MTPRRRGFEGTNSTTPSALLSDPALLVERAEAAKEALAAYQTDPLAILAVALERLRPAWHADAACRGSDVDFTSKGATHITAALEICSRCPVLLDCTSWALDEIHDDVAVLGGMTPSARRQASKTQQRSTQQKETNE